MSGWVSNGVGSHLYATDTRAILYQAEDGTAKWA